MGGDSPPDVLACSILSIVQEFPFVDFFVYHSPSVKIALHKQIHSIVCSETITMDDDPLSAIKNKQKSSLVRALFDVKSGLCDALITCANTGALVVGSVLHLKKLPHIRRPALVAELSLLDHPLYVLDVGGTIDRSSKQMENWAYLGSAYARASGVLNTRIGLLNIGSEGSKGAVEHKRVVQELFQNLPGFIGNIEPKNVLEGVVDVVVTDGFTGNILIKSFEAMSSFLLDQLPSGVMQNRNCQRVKAAKQQGALLTGLDAYVMKCHGSATPDVFLGALKKLIVHMQGGFLSRLSTELEASYMNHETNSF